MLNRIVNKLKLLNGNHKSKKNKTCLFGKHLDLTKATFSGYNKVFNGSCVSGSIFGIYSYVGSNAYLENVLIGKFSSIGNNVSIIPYTHPVNYVSTSPQTFSDWNYVGERWAAKSEFSEHLVTEDGFSAKIGNDVWIGSQVLIKGGVTIGDGAIIGMGAVVTSDVAPYAIVGGVPAKLIRYRFSPEIIKVLLATKWWDKPVEWIKEHAKYFNDIDKFIEVVQN